MEKNIKYNMLLLGELATFLAKKRGRKVRV